MEKVSASFKDNPIKTKPIHPTTEVTGVLGFFIKSIKETNEKLEEVLVLLKNIEILEKTQEDLWLQEKVTVELKKGNLEQD